jgi:hypothetical protein
MANQKKNENITSKSFTYDKEGEFTLTVRGEDKVGNVSDTVSYSILIDSTPPSTTLSTSKPLVDKDGVWMSGLPNKVELSSADQGAGVYAVQASYDKKNIFTVMARN